jgi:HlyD family secretion protein
MARSKVLISGVSVLGLVLAAGGLAVVLGGSGASVQPASGTDSSTPEDTAIVKKTSFVISLNATGDIFAVEQVELRNELGLDAKILELIPEGTKVEKDAIVARLSSEEVEKQIKEEASAVETARSELSAAQAGIEIQRSEAESALRKAQVTLELARLELRKWTEGEVVARRQKLALELDEARTEVSRTADKLKQARSLKERGFISSDDLQAAELANRKAEGALSTTVLNGTMFESFELPKESRTKENAVAEAEGELERTAKKNESTLAQKEAELANRKRQMELREQAMSKLAEMRDKAVLKAPVAGMVVYTSTINRWITDDNQPWRVGKTIHPGQPLVAIPELASLVAKVKVPETLSGKVKAGLSATIRVDARPGQLLTGTVDTIGTMAEQTWDEQVRSFSMQVKLGPERKALDLRPSMRVEAEILLDRVEDVLAVPVTAIFAEGPLRFVYRLRLPLIGPAGGMERVPIKLGRRSDRYAEVLSGLVDRDRVLVREIRPGEVPAAKWTDEQLAAGGCRRTPDGAIVLISPPAPPAEADAEPTTIELPGGGSAKPIPAGEVTPAAPAADATPAGAAPIEPGKP